VGFSGAMVVKHTSDRSAPKPVFFFLEMDEEAAAAFIAWRSPELVNNKPQAPTLVSLEAADISDQASHSE
jgi:hypothetical protein